MDADVYPLILAIAASSYLLGSVPTAYLMTRWARGVDIRQRGSGQVGGSNVWHTVSRKAGLVVAVLDVLKGVMVVVVARLAGSGVTGEVVAVVAALCGHNWSVFLRFSGGRGIATLGGAILVLAPRETGVFALFLLLGLMGKAVPAGVIVGVAALPAAAWYFKEPASLVFGLLAVFVVVLLKRIVPRRKLPSGTGRRVLLYRALFDRDVRSREEWVDGRGGNANRTGPTKEHRAVGGKTPKP